ncbi:MAG: hypothetical protein ACLFQB_13510 [Chitinispirillaceae bacterium]
MNHFVNDSLVYESEVRCPSSQLQAAVLGKSGCRLNRNSSLGKTKNQSGINAVRVELKVFGDEYE